MNPKSKKKILIADGLGKEGLDLLRTHPDLDLDIRKSISKNELLKQIHEYDALIVRTTTPVDAEIIKAGVRLRLIVTAGAGFDHIDVTKSRAQGITVLNCPTANSLSAAEQTLGLMFALARFIPQNYSALQAGRWERGPAFTGTELHGKILGIIGLGNIGKIVAEKAMALGMMVTAYDPLVSSISFLPPKFKYLEMRFKLARSQSEVLTEADWVTIHIPKEPKNIGLFGEKAIAEMKRGSFLVNVSRGGIVDEAALLTALKGDHLAGAATDVFTTEPPIFTDQTTAGLFSHPRFIATAHLGGATLEAKERIAAHVGTQVLAFFNSNENPGEFHA